MSPYLGRGTAEDYGVRVSRNDVGVHGRGSVDDVLVIRRYRTAGCLVAQCRDRLYWEFISQYQEYSASKIN